MDDQTKHSASFAPPVFKSRVVRARLLLEASGLSTTFDEVTGVVLIGDREVVEQFEKIEKEFDGNAAD